MIFIPFLFVIISIVVILIISNLEKFCFAGVCWQPVNQHISGRINFYFAVFVFFAVQFIILFIYWKLLSFLYKAPKKYSLFFDNVIGKIKGLIDR